MNETTYRDPALLTLLHARFITIRIDEAEHPALAARYADYGWPATVILSPEADAVIALRGHRPLPAFAALLNALVDELDRTGHVAERAADDVHAAADDDLARVRDRTLAQLDALYDGAEGGWGTPQKYPFAAPVEHAFFRAAVYGEKKRLEQALFTLAGHAKLIDPVAGGMYQYSVGGHYGRPHYEKLAQVQAGALANFAEAYLATHDPRWRDHGERVAAYVVSTLRAPDNAFFASQDADAGHFGEASFVPGTQYYGLDAAGRATRDAPKRDTHIYANLNGMLIRGLVALYRATGEAAWLKHAEDAAAAIAKTHTRGAGFAHEASTNEGASAFLSDQVEMAAALVALHEATGKRAYRDHAYATMDFAVRTFLDPKSHAFFAESADPNAVGVFATRETPYADNSVLSRLLLARSHVADDEHARDLGLAALRALSAPDHVAARGRKIGDYLVALEIAEAPYVMFTLVAPHADARALALRDAVRHAYVPEGMLALHEPGEGNYPYPGRPALYLCSESACSSPVFTPEAVAPAVHAFLSAGRAPAQ